MRRNLFLDTRPVTLRQLMPSIILVVVAMAVVVWATISYLDSLPTVYRQVDTGKCLAVLSSHGKPVGNCSRLPDRYDTVWVDSFVHPVLVPGKD